MKKSTNEFSFVLKPSHGVGVFAAHGIKKGTFLKLFHSEPLLLFKKDIPEDFQKFCIPDDDKDFVHAPENFSRMDIGWYLNHSDRPNAAHKNYAYFAAKDIRKGQEITINYNTLEKTERTVIDMPSGPVKKSLLKGRKTPAKKPKK